MSEPTMPDFAAMSDSEVNKWAAERDNIEEPHWWCERCQSPKSAVQVTYQEHCTTCGHIVIWHDSPDYVTSADALLGLLERWMFPMEIMLDDDGVWRMKVYTQASECFSQPTENQDGYFDVRALLNAGCAAAWQMEQEQGESK